MVEDTIRHLLNIGRKAELCNRIATLKGVILQFCNAFWQYKGLDGKQLQRPEFPMNIKCC